MKGWICHVIVFWNSENGLRVLGVGLRLMVSVGEKFWALEIGKKKGFRCGLAAGREGSEFFLEAGQGMESGRDKRPSWDWNLALIPNWHSSDPQSKN